ncbi:MAG: RNA polymerase sigma factor [Caldilineaceae bacterium]|jgi:RNA polymerase sigma-70 factor (ECF subfamily)
MFTEIFRLQPLEPTPTDFPATPAKVGRPPNTTPQPLVDKAAAEKALSTAQEEAALVERAKADPAAFGILYERYIDRVYAYIYHRVGNAQDTEDLTARTFYRALDKLHTYEDRGLPFSAWLFRIAHNLVANWHRDRGRRRFLSLDKLWSHSKEGDTPEEQIEREENHAALWDAIDRLPEERRNLLLYKFGSRLSNLEIGELLQKSESAIKSLYFRTLSTLRKELETTGWGTPEEQESAVREEA